MGSKSQRKKERHTQRRKEKRKQQGQSQGQSQERQQARQLAWDRQAVVSLGSNAQHRQRLSQQIPAAWPGELPEDVAIFEDAALSSLSPELAGQAAAVRDGLRDALDLRGDDALKCVATIPRSSSLSEWRLFIRGLVDWLDNKPDAAGEAWSRLNMERRPGRIATSMMVALRSDLEHASPTAESAADAAAAAEPSKKPWNRFDAQQLYHAKLLRRVRFDRAALRVAEAGVSIPEEGPELLLGPRKTDWLRRFIAEYGDTEPDLAAALAQTALGRAFCQQYSNLFDDAVGMLPGPRHDRRNRLLTFFYYMSFEGESSETRRAEQALSEYLKRELPQNVSLPEELRGAIASQIHLNRARLSMQPPGRSGFMDRMFGPPEDTKSIRENLLAAVKAYPGHRAAYIAHTGWIRSKLDDDDLRNSEAERLEKELANVTRKWSQNLPDDTEPRLWLVDHLLENEQMEEARPHVDFLAASRQDDPRVKAIPWKWQLLEAMRLCRRKAWLADVPSRLNEAESLWPVWLSKQWLPYLKAAWTLRCGQMEAFAEEHRQICEKSGLVRDALPDACMMLGAAQQMRVAAADLKPLRAALDRALTNIKQSSLEDLLVTGSFFWDLHRAQLVYPAYRMHGKIIGKQLIAGLEQNTNTVLDSLDNEQLQKAVLWASEYRFWPSNYDTKLPSFFSKETVQRHPVFIAAKLNALLKERYPWRIEPYKELGPLLRDAAASQRDAYYRRWFVQLADQLDDILAEVASRFSRFPFGNPMADTFGDEGEDDLDDDDFDLDFDPDCNCAECQFARQRAEERASRESPF